MSVGRPRLAAGGGKLDEKVDVVMTRLLPPWALLLVAAILFVAGMIWIRASTPDTSKPEDPVGDAVVQVQKILGMKVARQAGPDGGLAVEEVAAGSPAQRQGIQAGDRVMAVGDRSVWHAGQLADALVNAIEQRAPFSLLVARGEDYRAVVFGMRPGGGQAPAPAPSPAGAS